MDTDTHTNEIFTRQTWIEDFLGKLLDNCGPSRIIILLKMLQRASERLSSDALLAEVNSADSRQLSAEFFEHTS